MKIRITKEPPVRLKHGIQKGKVYEVVREGSEYGWIQWWVMGDADEEVGITRDEAEVIEQ